MDKIKDKYSLVIVGAGPAGFSASVYASRYKIDNLIIGQAIGGLMFEAHKVCNFPSEQEISGRELSDKMREHAEFLGASVLPDKVVSIEKEDNGFKITTMGGKEIFTMAIILAIGTKHRKLNLPNEEKFLGKGVSYCATCDAMFYKDKVVAVIGGANSAHTSSLYLSDIAKKVYQIYRKDKFRGETAWIEQVLSNNKIETIYKTQVVALEGENSLEKIILDNPYNGKKELEVEGIFVEIGTIPDLDLVKNLNLETDSNGYLVVGPGQETNQKGIWASGDITNASNGLRQVVTASSEGAIAADSVFKYLRMNS